MEMKKEPPGSLEALRRYWHSLAQGDTPERALLDPAAIKQLLPFLYIAEYETGPFRVRYILTGTEVDLWNGFNLTGRYIDEFIPADTTGANQILLDGYAQARNTGQPVFGTYHWPTRSGYPLEVKFGLFPLKVNGTIRQCLGIEDYSSFPADAEGIPFEDPAKVSQWVKSD